MATCVGCGYCCSKAPCVLGEGTPCVELIFKDGRHWCRLVLEAEGEDREDIELDLCIGDGCCSALNSERRKYVDRMELVDPADRDPWLVLRAGGS